MSGDEMTPERLDAILDGRVAPTDDEARDMLALAGALRQAAPGAGEDLRARVRALAEPSPAGGLRRLRGSGRRRRALIAAPALSAVAAAVIAVGVIARSPNGPQGASGGAQAERTSGSALEAAPQTSAAPATRSAPARVGAAGALAGPVVVQIPPATLDARLADVRRIVAAAGGTVDAEARRSTTSPSVLASITVPGDRSADVVRAITALGTAAPADASGDTSGFGLNTTPGVPARLDVLVTEGG